MSRFSNYGEIFSFILYQLEESTRQGLGTFLDEMFGEIPKICFTFGGKLDDKKQEFNWLLPKSEFQPIYVNL
jgi:hypothetical protein